MGALCHCFPYHSMQTLAHPPILLHALPQSASPTWCRCCSTRRPRGRCRRCSACRTALPPACRWAGRITACSWQLGDSDVLSGDPRLGMPTDTLNQRPPPSSPARAVLAVQPGGQRDAGGQRYRRRSSCGQCRCVHTRLEPGAKLSRCLTFLDLCGSAPAIPCRDSWVIPGRVLMLPLTHNTCRGRGGQRVGRRPARRARAAAPAGQPGAADAQPGAPALRL